MRNSFAGLLFIGDPHLCGRVPGFRVDDYPKVILAKLRWALKYAREHSLLPCLLGDLFHYPRDNANWLIVELMDLLDGDLLAISGNHDCGENKLTRDDTLSILVAAGRLRLVGDAERIWRGPMNGVSVAIGGTSWGQRLPKAVERGANDGFGSPRWVFWITHHDVNFPGYEEAAHLHCREIAGVDLVVNGHIHRRLEDVVAGGTTWCNPGNIARVSRSDASRAHEPSVLRVDVTDSQWTPTRIVVPHQPAEKVFQSEIVQAAAESSAFIDGLAALQRYKTDDGQGLMEFLDRQLARFEPAIAAHIRRLATEVLSDERAG